MVASHTECSAQQGNKIRVEMKRAERRNGDEADPSASAVDADGGAGALGRAGRAAAAAEFAKTLAGVVTALPPPPRSRAAFGPVPNAYQKAFGFWKPGFSPPYED